MYFNDGLMFSYKESGTTYFILGSGANFNGKFRAVEWLSPSLNCSECSKLSSGPSGPAKKFAPDTCDDDHRTPYTWWEGDRGQRARHDDRRRRLGQPGQHLGVRRRLLSRSTRSSASRGTTSP
jgi:hypothetical protein